MRLTSLLIIFPLALTACKPHDKDAGQGELWKDALRMCQKEVKTHAFDPATTRVPDVENSGQGSQFVFVWGPGSKPVLMNDGFGVSTQLVASCAVDAASNSIISLIVDGQQYMEPDAQ